MVFEVFICSKAGEAFVVFIKHLSNPVLSTTKESFQKVIYIFMDVPKCPLFIYLTGACPVQFFAEDERSAFNRGLLFSSPMFVKYQDQTPFFF